MIRAYKYKLKPTVKQQKLFSQAFGNARFIYNWGLNRKKETWENEHKNVTYLQLAKELTLLKKDGEHDWLKQCANVCLQQSLRNLDNAYTRFFKAKVFLNLNQRKIVLILLNTLLLFTLILKL